MGLLNSQRMANPAAPNLPQMPPNLPGMGGLPTFTPQQTQGPRMGGSSTFTPQQAGGGGYSPFQLPQIDLSSIPRYGHGYEGDVPFSQNTTRRDLFSGFTGPGAHGYPSMWGSSNPHRNMAWDASMMDNPTAFRQSPNSAATEAAEAWRVKNWR